MLDAGNPATPAAGALDIDGQAPVQEGDGACPVDPQRDIGADEFVAAVPTCATPPPPPASTTTKKKCKKAKKGAAAAKKKCKKRKK
jgi:hypothetical protein